MENVFSNETCARVRNEKRRQVGINDVKKLHQKTVLLSLQNQFMDSKLISEVHHENCSTVQDAPSPFNFLQASSMSVSPLARLYPGVQVLDSQLNNGNPNWNCPKSLSFHEIDTSRVDQLMPIINHLDSEALRKFVCSPCPAVKVEKLEDVMASELVGCPVPNTQVEEANISNNFEYEEPAEMDILFKLKMKSCSIASQQPEETDETTQARTPKASSSRIYRAKVSAAINALKNALPCSENGNQVSVLSNVIDYIKLLKYQLNVLSQNRLNGEASTHPFLHVEGFGHYLLHPQAYCHQPLEEMIGHLLKANPVEANELLECKGLAVVPLDSAYDTLLE